MADQFDLAQQYEEMDRAQALAAARAPIPAGTPGECDGCGEDMPRLVNGRCGYCRDGRLPPHLTR